MSLELNRLVSSLEKLADESTPELQYLLGRLKDDLELDGTEEDESDYEEEESSLEDIDIDIHMTPKYRTKIAKYRTIDSIDIDLNQLCIHERPQKHSVLLHRDIKFTFTLTLNARRNVSNILFKKHLGHFLG